jgi:hypothetical protein
MLSLAVTPCLIRSVHATVRCLFKGIAEHKLLAVQAIAAGWILDYILTSSHDDVMLPVLGYVSRALTMVWSSWSDHLWIYDLVPLLITCASYIFIGWIIAKLHPKAPQSMVFAYALFAFLYNLVFFTRGMSSIPTFSADPHIFRHRLILWAIRDSVSVIALLFGGGVFSTVVKRDASVALAG